MLAKTTRARVTFPKFDFGAKTLKTLGGFQLSRDKIPDLPDSKRHRLKAITDSVRFPLFKEVSAPEIIGILPNYKNIRYERRGNPEQKFTKFLSPKSEDVSGKWWSNHKIQEDRERKH